MNLPIPEFGEFIAGFATCAGLTVGSVVVRHAWPKIKALVTTTESTVYTEYKAAISFFDAKLNGLSSSFASAVNTIRGDVQGVQRDLAEAQDRLVTLEKAVGIQDPTADKASPAPTQVLDGRQSSAPAAVPLA